MRTSLDKPPIFEADSDQPYARRVAIGWLVFGAILLGIVTFIFWYFIDGGRTPEPERVAAIREPRDLEVGDVDGVVDVTERVAVAELHLDLAGVVIGRHDVLSRGRYNRRSTFGKSRHTGTPQNFVPSVQRGEIRPLRTTQGGPTKRIRRGWTARTCSTSSIDAM